MCACTSSVNTCVCVCILQSVCKMNVFVRSGLCVKYVQVWDAVVCMWCVYIFTRLWVACVRV